MPNAEPNFSYTDLPLLFNWGMEITSFGKKLGDILKGLKFQSVTGRVIKEHGGLFAYQTFKTDIWFYHELDIFGPKCCGKIVKLFPFQYNAIMGNGYVLSIHGIGVQGTCIPNWFVMDYQLVSKEVKIHPVVATSPFRATKDFPIKGSALVKVMYGDGDVKGSDG
tara:strand:+ start:154251 stop:154745 length:495 start_codon:yes stop_codon:yes gene_type:complete